MQRARCRGLRLEQVFECSREASGGYFHGSYTSSDNGPSCNIPLSYTGPCSDGGTISVSGDVSGTLDKSGDGSFSTQITITPTNCAVSGTTFNGDPDITNF